MKIVIAIDSYKGSATSLELGLAAGKAVEEVLPDAEAKIFEIADGGEGTISTLQHELGGELISVETIDLLERPIEAKYLLLGELAVIESATVVGIDKIIPSPESIQKASSFGLAALIIDAISHQVREIYLTLGGTGSSDGGLGLLEGLGVDLNDFSNLPDLPKLTALADVTNPYAGEMGYAHFFGKQKGATADIIEAQDEQAMMIVKKVRKSLNIDLQSILGTGAAGGIGGAIAILGGTIEAGFPKIAGLLNIEAEIASADLVITGEGRMDAQTANGKVPWGMAQLAAKYKVPTLAICGALADDLGKMNEVLAGAYSIQTRPISYEAAIENKRTLENVTRLCKNLLKTWRA
ncbi:MAG: glycerate kinase [Streptococcaceae bacterium]|jgi:glycerate kinase|nr:glycerate kinase [Streptococcaceae bacterium]